MTSPERAAGAVPLAASNPAAQPGAATQHHAAPGPQPTAGAVVPDPAAPAVTHGGWAASLTLAKSHYVPAGPILDVWFGRPVALTLDGWNALVDKLGLEDGTRLPRCVSCTRVLARMLASSRQAQQ